MAEAPRRRYSVDVDGPAHALISGREGHKSEEGHGFLRCLQHGFEAERDGEPRVVDGREVTALLASSV